MLIAMICGALLTLFVLWLSIVTIQKGYGYKHRIDPPAATDETYHETANKES